MSSERTQRWSLLLSTDTLLKKKYHTPEVWTTKARGQREEGNMDGLWYPCTFCQWFVKEIMTSYKTNKKLEQMLKNLDIYVTPVINVDGYIYTWVNETRLVCQMTVVQTYCGKASGSEPEASAVMNLVGQMVDQTLCFLTIHSAGQLILLPYGHPQISAPNYDELVSVGEAAAAEMNKLHGMGYTVGTSPQILYPNSGSSLDWARLIGIPFSYTFELRDKGEFSHLLPEDQIQPACQEAYAGVLSIITYVHDKAFNSGAVPNAAVSGVALLFAAI
ncbi:hypothetical protein PBY51_022787 [Eleginops maclovinus]|uniref:Peptidase M14 domain-containing protein n=1 Tax=Eleginops maclovinus TaxID=56733 RepID=A0AAN7XIL0_ELEMC|nr:hypothetical protein PBY51_022787 [Eleginops maclovinus]